MSRRTAESNKAILAAWNKEKELVLEGKGTREWTLQQQKDILNKGKAYDDEGFAFQGQHMKSAEQYPEYQGDPNNIQFLTRTEHLEAHNGNWRNPTNWYYNPVTKEKIDFGDGPVIPCVAIRLSDPVVKLTITEESDKDQRSELTNTVDIKSKYCEKKKYTNKRTENSVKPGIKESKKVGSVVQKAFKSVGNFSKNHPILMNIVKITGVVASAVATVESISKRGSSISENIQSGDRINYDYVPNETNESYDDNSDESKRVYTPNDVPAGKQRYHYRDGSVKWKDKPPYHRGDNNKE